MGGRSNVLDFDRVVELEFDYIKAWSLWQDLRLLVRTVPAVLLAEGSA